MSDTRPKAHENNSFSYKVINRKIKEELDRRADLNNTVQLGMPFVKATTTVQLSKILNFKGVSEDAYGFTLGTHAISQDVTYEDIYGYKSQGPLLGYTYTRNGTNQLVYADADTPDPLRNAFVEQYGALLTNQQNFKAIPPPGITGIRTHLNRAGVAAHAEISFAIPTLMQLEMLSKIFLVPGVGMILEWGQQFAEYNETSTKLTTTTINDNMFPWYDRQKVETLLRNIGEKRIGIEEIYQNYVYPTGGQYQWMFGRVANFNVRMESDSSYTGTVKIVGQGEESWAYSTMNTIGKVSSRGQNICLSDGNSIQRYFSNQAPGLNFKSLLTAPPVEWKDHVIYIPKGNESQGEPTETNKTTQANVSEQLFSDSEDAYFVTWKFFVNVVLNDESRGLRALYKNALGAQNSTQLNKISLLRKIDGDDDPYENYVGANKHLRSTDPSVMIIVNETAAKEFEKIANSDQLNITENDISKLFRKNGDFYNSIENCSHNDDRTTQNDKGFLSKGVWLNHKAIVQSIVGSQTLVDGIANLLNRMNTSTLGFWQLTLDAQDPLESNKTIDYAVVDANYKESSIKAVNRFANEVYTFNKFNRGNGDTLTGSEAIECELELNLPKRLFAQIATLGMLRAEDVAALNASTEEEIPSPQIAHDNTRMEKMFAITIIDPTKTTGNPDLTYGLRTPNAEGSVCTNTDSRAPGGTQGSGNATALPSIDALQKRTASNEELRNLLNTDVCKNCLSATTSPAPGVPQLSIPPGYYISQAGEQVIIPVVQNARPSQNSAVGATTLYEKGYRNGQFPNNVLASVSSDGTNIQVYRELVQPLNNLIQLFTQNGLTLRFSSGYRSLASQIYVAQKRGLFRGPPAQGEKVREGGFGFAADPGTSDHGWGLAVDIQNTPEAINFLNTNIQTLTSLGFSRDIASEPWHLVFIRPLLNVPQNTITTAPTPNTQQPTSTDAVCLPCKQAQAIVAGSPEVQSFVRKFENLNQVFRYVEPYGNNMITRITSTADDIQSNPFGSAPGPLAIKANITLPGINGLRPGELFWVDRIPSMYKLIGAFQIHNLQHTIDVSGWRTQITSTFYYLGRKWRESISAKYGTTPESNITAPRT